MSFPASTALQHLRGGSAVFVCTHVAMVIEQANYTNEPVRSSVFDLISASPFYRVSSSRTAREVCDCQLDTC
jgi:hypothetical protein